jgi:NAD(P)-dependent dehydrogenase (short-subunit alcohol dehydrogenase family)
MTASRITDDLFSLKGRTALITGGSRGIGRMIAQGFVELGARVYISSRKAEACMKTAEELSAFGTCIAIPGDVSSLAGVTALADAYKAHEPTLDILVNNAGAAWRADFDTFPEKGWDKVMDVNVKGVFFLTQSLAGHLRAAAAAAGRPAKVINVASVDGLTVNQDETYSYGASKAAVIMLTKRMALKLAKDQVMVSAICPGAFPSEMNLAARDHGDAMSALIPSGRVGVSEDMAGTAIYLASKAGDYVTGTTVAVDGGVTLVTVSASMDD